jgi:pteridine reductase
MTKVLAKELGPKVRVNAVAPGAILWPEDNNLSEQAKAEITQRVLLKRSGDPRDIAKAVLFLIKDADYITGQIITVDGGRSLFC